VQIGRGVFSTVMRVHDTFNNNRELVIKLIRNREIMKEAGIRGDYYFVRHFIYLPLRVWSSNSYFCVILFFE
jgi:hypothetical protein